MKKMLVVKMNGQVEERENTGLECLQSAVGGWIEGIDLGNGAMMYCNEEGKCSGLPANLVATRLYEAVYGAGIDIIVGDVCIIGTKNPAGEIDGEDYDVPAWVAQRAHSHAQGFAPRCVVR
jgi:hypothetical protein